MMPIEHARVLDAKIRRLGRREKALKAEIAYRLRRMKDLGLYRYLGKASIGAYARAALGYSASQTRDLISLSRRLDERKLEKTKQAFLAGELHWTKVRSLSSVASPKSEELWLQKARTMSSRRLELEAKRARGEPAKSRSVFDWTEEERALVDDALNAVRKDAKRALTDAEAMILVVRRALKASAGGSSCYRVVIRICEECGLATRQTNEGEMEVDACRVEEALCDADVVDITGPPKPVSRTMPPKTARYLDARDPCCRVPGCYNRIDLDRHHEGGWRNVGHDPNRCLRLCTTHHVDRHEGRLIIEGQHPDFIFKLCDGTVLEEPTVTVPDEPAATVPDEPAADEPTGERPDGETIASREATTHDGDARPAAGASHEAAPGPNAASDPRGAAREAAADPGVAPAAGASREAALSRRELDETVIAALRGLQLKPREAERAVRRARERLAEPPEDVPTLLGAALRYS